MSQLITQAGGVSDPESIIEFLNSNVSPSAISNWNKKFGIQAETFGVSVAASAQGNATNLNIALASGGFVSLTTPGTYSAGASLVIPDNTELYLGKGVIIQRAAGVNAPLLKNRYEAYLLNNADLSRTASATVVVNDYNHTRQVGETVIVGQCQTAAYNGAVTVTATTQHTWSYTSGGSATDTGGASGYYATIIPVRATVLSANVAGASNFVTVTDAALANKLKPGDDIWVGSTATDTNFVGQKTVSSVIPGVSFSYASTSASGAPTGNLLFNFNVGITLSGQGQLDGNRANQSAPGSGATLGMRVNTVNMSMVSRFRVNDGLNITGAIYRSLNCFNCSNVLIDATVKDTLVGVQFEGSGKSIIVNRLRGESVAYNTTYSKFQSDDFIAFTGTHYIGNAGYDNVTSPYGLGNFDFDLFDIAPTNCKNGVKITGYNTVHYKGKIRRVVGGALNPVLINGSGTTVGVTAGINIMDDAVGGGSLVGSIVDDLEIDYVNFHDAYASAALSGVIVTNSGANKRIKIGYIDDGADLSNLVEIDQNTGSTVDLVMERQQQVYDMTSNTKPRYLFNSGTVKKIKWNDSTFIPPTTNGAASISFKAAFVYSEVILKDSVYGGNSAFSGQFIAHASVPATFIFDNFNPGATAYGIHQPFYNTYHGAGTMNFKFSNSEIWSDSFLSDDSNAGITTTFNYYANGLKWTAGGNNFIQTTTPSTHNLYGGTDNALASNVALISTGSQVINLYCDAARIDVTTNVRLGKPMGSKAWNTNAALGTLGAAGPVISDGTNWHLMTDTTKLY